MSCPDIQFLVKLGSLLGEGGGGRDGQRSNRGPSCPSNRPHSWSVYPALQSEVLGGQMV